MDKQQKYNLAEKYMRRIKADFPSLAWDDASCLGTLFELIDEAEKIISFTHMLADVPTIVDKIWCPSCNPSGWNSIKTQFIPKTARCMNCNYVWNNPNG